MHARLTLALFVSIFLIGGALWVRLSEGAKINYELALVEPNKENDAALDFFLNPIENAAATLPAPPLSTTDIISRQLFSDYLAMSANNQADVGNINFLINKYVDGVGELHNFQRAQYSNIRVTSNNKDNYNKYANELAQLYIEYEKLISDAFSGINNGSSNVNTYVSFAKKSAGIYGNMALKLENLPVPIGIANLHLELVNIHRSNTEAMTSISNLEKDPLPASASFMAINQNLNQEAITLGEMGRIIKTNAI